MVNVEMNGLLFRARALIDYGSEATFISGNIRYRIVIPCCNIAAQVTGVNQTIAPTPSKVCDLATSSPINTKFKFVTQVFVLKTITCELPTYPSEIIQELQLADPDFFVTLPVDIIIGSDIYLKIICSGIQHNVLHSLLQQGTAFRWILSGPISANKRSTL